MMAFLGGYMGAYALWNRSDVFGNAQTNNLIHIVMNIFGGNIQELLIRLGALGIYMTGIVLVVIWPKITKISVHILAIVIDAAAFFFLGFLPKEMNLILSLYPVFFATAVQWSAFPSVYGYNCSTIFSTNNLKQFTSALTEYVCSHEKKHLHKAKFYGEVLLFYHLGVAAACIISMKYAIQAAWFGLLPLCIAIGLVIKEEKIEKEIKLNSKFV